MSPLFGRGGGEDERRERSESEREAARREREARRAAREGRGAPPPVEPVAPAPAEPGAPAPVEPPAASDPAPDPSPRAPQPAATPVAREVIDFSPPPPQVVQPPARPVEPPPRRVPPPPTGPRPFDPEAARAAATATAVVEEPIGVKRVSAAELPSPPDGGRGGRLRGRRRRNVAPGVPRVPRSRRGTHRVLPVVALLIVIAVGWLGYSLYQPFHGDGGAPVTVRIPSGSGAGTVGDLLAERGVVSSSFFFRLRTRLSGGTLKSGTHHLRRDMSYGAAIEQLGANPPAAKTLRVTLPEGLSRGEAAPVVVRDGVKGSYIKASRRSPRLNPRKYSAPKGTTSLEGFLFPATYELKIGASAQKLVHDQLNAFVTNLAKVDLRRAKRKNLTTYDVVTIASMIEREAMAAKDRRLISAVIYNRLKRHIPVGIDATIRYRLNNWTRPLRVSDLQTHSVYNTRTHQGLPPTPIGNPGLASLQAAANPAHVTYLYYVVKPCGNGAHAFSSTDARFQQDVRRYNAARAKRGGKDPSRC